MIRFFILICLIGGLFSSCHINQAKPANKKTLVIASDYLDAGDTTLFSSFSREHNVTLIIKPMSTDAVIGLMRNKKYNSGLDLILSSSSHSAYRLWKEKLLQVLNEEDEKFDQEHEFVSFKYSYVALGIDPFVIYYPSDTLITARTYQDLFKIPHYCTLNHDELLAFLSPLRAEKNQVETYKWIEKWNKLSVRSEDSNSWSDSLPAILTKYSNIVQLNDSFSHGNPDRVIFPNGLRKGCYYDVLTMAIVKQAENYVTAKDFIAHYSNAGHNSMINETLGTYPLYEYLSARKDGLELNPVSSESLLQYHRMIERILNKLK